MLLLDRSNQQKDNAQKNARLKMVMAKRALITGITGQDGSYLAELLLNKGYHVYGLVRRLSVRNVTNICNVLPKVHIIDGDLADYGSIAEAMRESDPDEIYHLAAQSFVEASFSQPVFTGDVTGLGVTRVLEAARTIVPEARIYNASTSELFGNTTEHPQNEETPFRPQSPYAVAKLYGYWMCRNYREAYGIFASNGILFNHESPRRGKEFVTRKISYTVAAMKLGLVDRIVLGNIDAKRDWGFAPEYVEAMWRMLQLDRPEDLVIATGEMHSVREFLDLALQYASVSPKEIRIEVDPRLYRPRDVPALCGDASKAKRVLGWKPRTSFRKLVQIMIDEDIALVKKEASSGCFSIPTLRQAHR